jgi:hypothetical protein
MSKFKVGDRVRVVKDGERYGGSWHKVPIGHVVQVVRISGYEIDTDSGWFFHEDEIELVTATVTPPASPVRTVTRREIVDGNYNGVEISVGGVPWGKKRVRFDATADAQSLREAARIFNEIADVLDEEKEDV